MSNTNNDNKKISEELLFEFDANVVQSELNIIDGNENEAEMLAEIANLIGIDESAFESVGDQLEMVDVKVGDVLRGLDQQFRSLVQQLEVSIKLTEQILEQHDFENNPPVGEGLIELCKRIFDTDECDNELLKRLAKLDVEIGLSISRALLDTYKSILSKLDSLQLDESKLEQTLNEQQIKLLEKIEPFELGSAAVLFGFVKARNSEVTDFETFTNNVKQTVEQLVSEYKQQIDNYLNVFIESITGDADSNDNSELSAGSNIELLEQWREYVEKVNARRTEKILEIASNNNVALIATLPIIIRLIAYHVAKSAKLKAKSLAPIAKLEAFVITQNLFNEQLRQYPELAELFEQAVELFERVQTRLKLLNEQLNADTLSRSDIIDEQLTNQIEQLDKQIFKTIYDILVKQQAIDSEQVDFEKFINALPAPIRLLAIMYHTTPAVVKLWNKQELEDKIGQLLQIIKIASNPETIVSFLSADTATSVEEILMASYDPRSILIQAIPSLMIVGELLQQFSSDSDAENAEQTEQTESIPFNGFDPTKIEQAIDKLTNLHYFRLFNIPELERQYRNTLIRTIIESL